MAPYDLFGQLGRVVFRGQYLDAVLAKLGLIVGAVIAVTGEAV